MSLSHLKKRKKNSIERLQKKAANTLGGNRGTDDRFWTLSKDKTGNGHAVIRFLEAPEGNDAPWVMYYEHGFQGPTGQWYIEKSRTTLGDDETDPVGELNRKLWATGLDRNKETVRKRARKTRFVSNILVINDPSAPENNGKVFLFRYGKSIFRMIQDAMKPEFEDEEPFLPFDFWEGANLKLRVRIGENGWPTYDKSEFMSLSPLGDTDEEIEAIYKQCYDLNEFIDPASFKSYDQLKQRLMVVLGEEANASGTGMSKDESVDLDEEVSQQDSVFEREESSSMESEPTQDYDNDSSSSDDDDDEDDIMGHFAKLASSD
jgi:hypothetical protein